MKTFLENSESITVQHEVIHNSGEEPTNATIRGSTPLGWAAFVVSIAGVLVCAATLIFVGGVERKKRQHRQAAETTVYRGGDAMVEIMDKSRPFFETLFQAFIYGVGTLVCSTLSIVGIFLSVYSIVTEQGRMGIVALLLNLAPPIALIVNVYLI